MSYILIVKLCELHVYMDLALHKINIIIIIKKKFTHVWRRDDSVWRPFPCGSPRDTCILPRHQGTPLRSPACSLPSRRRSSTGSRRCSWSADCWRTMWWSGPESLGITHGTRPGRRRWQTGSSAASWTVAPPLGVGRRNTSLVVAGTSAPGWTCSTCASEGDSGAVVVVMGFAWLGSGAMESSPLAVWMNRLAPGWRWQTVSVALLSRLQTVPSKQLRISICMYQTLYFIPRRWIISIVIDYNKISTQFFQFIWIILQPFLSYIIWVVSTLFTQYHYTKICSLHKVKGKIFLTLSIHRLI